MKVHVRIFAIVIWSLCGSAQTVSSDVVHGFAEIFYSWDFSESTSVGEYEGDLSIVYVVDPPLGYWYGCWNGAGALIVDSTFDELTTAPEDTSLYHWEGPALLGKTYVIRTAESHYAKFRILYLLPLPYIEYAYQPDGTRTLVDAVGVESTTWGRIKSIYSTP